MGDMTPAPTIPTLPPRQYPATDSPWGANDVRIHARENDDSTRKAVNDLIARCLA